MDGLIAKNGRIACRQSPSQKHVAAGCHRTWLAGSTDDHSTEAGATKIEMTCSKLCQIEHGVAMTELLYQTDSYLQEFDAEITSVLLPERAVVLDRTAFYPGGGGQPCDFGTLTVAGVTYPVDKVKKQGEDVLHFLGGDVPLPAIGSASR